VGTEGGITMGEKLMSIVEAIPIDFFKDKANEYREHGGAAHTFVANLFEALIRDWNRFYNNKFTQFHMITWHTMDEKPISDIWNKLYITMRDEDNPDVFTVEDNWGYYCWPDGTPTWFEHYDNEEDVLEGSEKFSRFVAWAYMPTILPYGFCEDEKEENNGTESD
jgi:hypothetical protein